MSSISSPPHCNYVIHSHFQTSQDLFFLTPEEIERRKRVSQLLLEIQESKDMIWADHSHFQVSQDLFFLTPKEIERRERVSQMLLEIQESKDKIWADHSHFQETEAPENVERKISETDDSDSPSLIPSTEEPSPSQSLSASASKPKLSSSSDSEEQSEQPSNSLQRAFSDLDKEYSEEFLYSISNLSQAPDAVSTANVPDQMRRIIDLWTEFRPEHAQEIIFNNSPYKMETKAVGEGCFKKVFVATSVEDSPTKRKVAVIYAKTNTKEDSLAISREVETLKLCRKKQIPGVLQLLDNDLQVGRFFKRFVTDYCNGGDLISWSKDKSLTSKLEILLGVAETLEALHSNEFAHGDIKSANIAIKITSRKERSVVLDFGSFTENGNELQNPHHRTLSYYPPIGGDLKNRSTPIQADVFCFGATLFDMIHQSGQPAALYTAVSKKDPTVHTFYTTQEDIDRAISLLPKIPEDIRNLLQSILKINPAERPTMKNVREELESIILEYRGTGQEPTVL